MIVPDALAGIEGSDRHAGRKRLAIHIIDISDAATRSADQCRDQRADIARRQAGILGLRHRRRHGCIEQGRIIAAGHLDLKRSGRRVRTIAMKLVVDHDLRRFAAPHALPCARIQFHLDLVVHIDGDGEEPRRQRIQNPPTGKPWHAIAPYRAQADIVGAPCIHIQRIVTEHVKHPGHGRIFADPEFRERTVGIVVSCDRQIVGPGNCENQRLGSGCR